MMRKYASLTPSASEHFSLAMILLEYDLTPSLAISENTMPEAKKAIIRSGFCLSQSVDLLFEPEDADLCIKLFMQRSPAASMHLLVRAS
jgi:hypothetical protein